MGGSSVHPGIKKASRVSFFLTNYNSLILETGKYEPDSLKRAVALAKQAPNITEFNICFIETMT